MSCGGSDWSQPSQGRILNNLTIIFRHFVAMDATVADHLRSPRQRTYKGARIFFNGRTSSIDCVIKNLSDTGACLSLPNTIGVPETFDLLQSKDQVRACKVIWRNAKQVGVQFR
jgi:hypothetical protein